MCVETFPVPEPMRDEEERGGGRDVLPDAWETDRALKRKWRKWDFVKREKVHCLRTADG